MSSHDAENVSWGHFLYKVMVYHGKRTQVPEKRSKWFVWKNKRFDSFSNHNANNGRKQFKKIIIMRTNYDYVCIGSSGFAQLGKPDFYQKNRIENSILIDYFEKVMPVPEEFEKIAGYIAKRFDHEFGKYREVVILYNMDYIYDLEEDDPEKYERFWEWVNKAKCVNIETTDLLEEMKTVYELSIA